MFGIDSRFVRLIRFFQGLLALRAITPVRPVKAPVQQDVSLAQAQEHTVLDHALALLDMWTFQYFYASS